MAAPAFQAAGAVVKGGGTVSPAWPAHQTNDVALLFVETANQAATLSDAQGFVEVTNSPQGTGTAGTSGATRLTVFWCRATGAAMAAPTVADSGDHQIAFIATFRGCIETGNPWDVTAGNTAASTTAVSIPTATTTVAETLVVLAVTNNGTIDTTQVTAAPTNAALSTITKRVDTQPTLPALGSTKLQVGPYNGLTDLMGIGPGGDSGAPYYRIAGINPHSMLSTLEAQLEIAEALDITVFATTNDSPAAYGASSSGGFNQAQYDAKIDVLCALPYFVDAVNRGRVVCLIGDEPNHSKWDVNGVNTFTPTVVNTCGRNHKSKFAAAGAPNCITAIRVDCHRLRFGWKSNGPPVSGYDGLDYGIYQHEGPGSQLHQSFLTAYNLDKADGAAVNVGCIPALNLWAGGPHVDVDGISACWDYLNSGTSSGVIAGSVQGSPSPYSTGQQIACATWNATPTSGKKTLVSSPAWIQRVSDVCAADADMPWLLYWTHARPTLGEYPWINPLQTRSDFIASLDYSINKGLSRSSFNGFRVTKVFP